MDQRILFQPYTQLGTRYIVKDRFSFHKYCVVMLSVAPCYSNQHQLHLNESQRHADDLQHKSLAATLYSVVTPYVLKLCLMFYVRSLRQTQEDSVSLTAVTSGISLIYHNMEIIITTLTVKRTVRLFSLSRSFGMPFLSQETRYCSLTTKGNRRNT